MTEVRYDWTQEEISKIYHSPLLDLIFRAATIHRENEDYAEVQISSLISIKTGGCPEDCAYCPQAARYNTGVDVHAIMPKEEVIAVAQKAKNGGASRLCMGAAWREVRDNRDFDKVIDMVKAVNAMDMEVCCTLGMLTESQAQRLADAGLYAYNHNLDTSEDDYKRIITTRTYDDRLQTLDHVRKAKISVCSGGIIGLRRNRARPHLDAENIIEYAKAPRVCSDQRIGTGTGHTFGRPAARFCLGYGKDDCHHPHHHAKNCGKAYLQAVPK
jgi:biotin synthase